MHNKNTYEQALGLKRNGLKIKQIHDITGVAKSTLRDWFSGKTKKSTINIHDPVDIILNEFDGNARNKALDAYSYTLGFYFSRGHIYKNKRTFELSFHVDQERSKKFLDAFYFIFNDKKKVDNNADKKSISIYGKDLQIFYPQVKEIQLWQTKIIDLPKLFKGMVDAFDVAGDCYIFKTNNDKIQNMFRGCCSQFGMSFTTTECDKTRIDTPFSLNRIKKILLDSWESEL